MLNKKALLMGLAASLAIAPFLVAQLTPPASPPPQPAPVDGGDSVKASGGVGARPMEPPRFVFVQGPATPIASAESPWQEAQNLLMPKGPLQSADAIPLGGLGYLEALPPATAATLPPAPLQTASLEVVPAPGPMLPAPPEVVQAPRATPPASAEVIQVSAPMLSASPEVVQTPAPMLPASPEVVQAPAPMLAAFPEVVQAPAPMQAAFPEVIQLSTSKQPAPPEVVQVQAPIPPPYPEVVQTPVVMQPAPREMTQTPAPVSPPPAPRLSASDTAPSVPVIPPPAPAATAMLAIQEKQADQPPKKDQPPTAAPAPTPTDLDGLRPTAAPPATFGRESPPTSAGQSTIGPSAATAPANLSSVLSNSNSATGVEVQKRSPLIGDPRIDGLHFGQVVTYADGAYWFPARVDLDTVISKLNANISNVDIVKGPFSVRYGPGFSFLNVESLPTPRSDGDYFDVHGSTSLRYQTNATAWQGQQSASGGNSDWGFRISYDAQTADDYASGNGTKMPSSYNNQFVNFAIGFDLSKDSSLELRYMHVQQSNVLIPGLVTDINELISDAFSARYTAVKGSWYDKLTIDAWVNATTFNGDSSNPQTRQMVPGLDNFLQVPVGFSPVRLDITTNGYALSYGAREITTWGDTKGFNISVGADIRVFSSFYNEFDSFNFSTAGTGSGQSANLGIPNGRQIDPGLLADSSIPIGEHAVVKVGTRVDFVTTQFLGFAQNQNLVDPLDPPATDYVEHVGNPQGDKTFFLFSAYLTGQQKLSNELTVTAGYGYAERAPTLTELYAGGAFLGLLQNGLNSFYGNAQLRKEEIHQLDLGFNADYETFRIGGNAFYAYIPNYITYNRISSQFTVTLLNANGGAGPTFPTTVPNFGVFRFMNTNLASMYGFNGFVEYDVTSWLTPFATLSYVDGRDQTRHEWLPGIAPLDTRIGLRLHDRAKQPKWGVEYFARLVAVQDQFASSLGEERTGGFVVHNVRAYWQARENLLLLAGVENLGNLQYREALDLRTPPVGVFQPGINFYVGMKVSY